MSEKWDRRFLQLAQHIASWSKDPSTQVGAVIVESPTNIIVGLGYNGFPRGVHDYPERYSVRETKLSLVVHAEVNAILMAERKAKGATLYVWPSFLLPPICNECCKIAVQAGIKEIVGYSIDEVELNDRQRRWKDAIILSRQMCDEAGIIYRGITNE